MAKTPSHSERAHAILSASAAERWIACPGSVRLSRGLEKRGSVYAAEGTAAHELAEKCLRTLNDADFYIGDDIHVPDIDPDTGLDRGGWDFTVDDDMAEAVQVYLDFVRPKMEGNEWDAEQRFDLTHLHPNLGGTGDLVIFIEPEAILDVNDYKHGRGHAVDAIENMQMFIYALGAMLRMHNRGVRKIRMNIIQPRCPHAKGRIRTWEITPSDLIDRAVDLVEAARRTDDPDAPLVAGEHCVFCPAAAVCPALYEDALKVAQDTFGVYVEPHKLSKEELKAKLDTADRLETWIRKFKEYAHQEAEAGRTPDGWKLVQKRALRRWVDDTTATADINNRFGIPVEDLYVRKLKSPAQVEKLLPKEARAQLGDLVVKNSSGTVLVPDTDAREAVKPTAISAFEVLNADN